MKIINSFKNFLRFSIKSWQQFYEDDVWNKAGSLAYITLLSITPLLTIVFFTIAAFPAFKEFTIEIQDLVFSHLVTESAENVQHYLKIFIEQANQLSAIGMMVLLLTAVILVFSMEHTFNSIWHLKKNRKGMPAFFLYWGVITIIPIAIASIMWITNYFTTLALFKSLNIVWVKDILRFFRPYLITFFALTALYISLPNRKIPIKSASISAIISTIMFEISRKGFALYITEFATYKIIYGAIAAVPIFLMWLYISWLIILFGAVINSLLISQQSQSTCNRKI